MKKAISPLIASVILVAITVGLAVLVGSWLRNYAASQTADTKKTSTSTIQCFNARVNIKNVVLYSGDVVVVVENNGLRDLRITRIVAYNSTVASCTVYENTTGVPLNAGEMRVFRGRCGGDFGIVERVRVSTNCPSVYDVWVNESA